MTPPGNGCAPSPSGVTHEEDEGHGKIRQARTVKEIHPYVAQWGVRSIARAAGTWAFIEGVIIILGGPDRWRSPSFATALQVPFAPTSWGVVALLLGPVIVVGTFLGWRGARVVGVALCALASWALFFALTFGITAWGNPYAATTAAPTYFFVAVGLIVLGVIYFDSGRAGPQRKEP